MRAARDAAGRVRRAGLPLRFRLEGLRRDGRGVRSPAARGTRRVAAAAAADLHALDEGDVGARREHRPRCGRGADRRGALRRGGAGRPGALRVRLGVRAQPRDHPRGHEARIRSRPGGPARARRRGLHARLVALLAGRRLPAGRNAAVVRQAVRARLLRAARLGQDAARPGAARRRRRRHARSLRRGVRAADRASRSPTTSPIQGWSAREGDRSRPPETGHPRPAGTGRRELAAPPRLLGRRGSRRTPGRRRPADRRPRRRHRPAEAHVRAAADESPDRELRARARRRHR